MGIEILSPGDKTAFAATELQPLLTGKMLIEGDVDYDQCRKIWNGMIDRKPAVIVQCQTTDDICFAVKFARKHNLLLSVKAGGHNISGNAVCDGGLMIDLSGMKKVKVNADEKLADVEMGATWGDFDKVTQEYGLATTGGVVSSTGVAGLTLGGGVGWLVRKHGLSCDNLVAAEVVNADGNLIQTSLLENPDLLWGLRGGAGNFGVVSSMRFRLHETGPVVLGGMILHTRDKAREVLQFYREYMKTAPKELTLYTGLLTSPDGIPLVAYVGCYSGDMEEGERVIQPLRNFGNPVADLFQPIPYVQVQTLLDASVPHGHRYYWKSGFLKELSDEAIDTIISHMASNPSPFSATIFELYGGAATQEPEGGTAYPHREVLYDLVIMSNWVDTKDDQVNISWNRKLWEALQPYFSDKVYVNTLSVEGQDRVKEAYGKNYEKLGQLKRKYDPDNFFQMNQNILPA
jgi:hypothetical protein